MNSGLNITDALSIEITILATELAVLAIFPAARQMLGELKKQNLYAGYSASRLFDIIVYINLVTIIVALVGVAVGSLVIAGMVNCWSDAAVLYSFLATVTTFSILAAVLAVIVSLQIVRH